MTITTMNQAAYMTAENAAFINGVHAPQLCGRKAVARQLARICNFKGGYRAAWRASGTGYRVGGLTIRDCGAYGRCLVLG